MVKSELSQSNLLRLLFQQNSSSNDKISRDAAINLVNYYASLGNNSPHVIMVLSLEGELLSKSATQQQTIADFSNINELKNKLHNNSYEKLEKAFQTSIKGTPAQCEVEIKRKKKFFDLQFIPIQGQNEKVAGIGLVIRDQTILKLEDLTTKSENKGLKLIFDNLNIGVWVNEVKDGKLVYASEGLAELYDYPIDSFYEEQPNVKQIIYQFVHQEDRKKVLKYAIEALYKLEAVQLRYRIISRDGNVKWISCHTTPYMDDNGEITHIFGMQTDITEEVNMQEQLKYSANHDILTTLPNQRSLDEKLAQLFEEKKRFALLFLNLDRFSVINGSLGYQVGDEVLKTIATRLSLILPENSFIARLRSNDFIILMEDYESKEFIVSTTENLINDIKQPLIIDEYEINMTTSVGVSLYPEDGDTREMLMEKAHTALSHAKKIGRNTFRLYSYSKDTAFQRKLAIEKDMIAALEKEEFELYYQPLVETQTGSIVGAEALIRWNHKEWGLISPGEFIPIAEENHLISDISDWVIQKACWQIRQWLDKGLNIASVSVNISPIRLMKKGFTDYVKHQLERFGISASYLGVEITEGSLLKSEQGVLTTLAELKELGVRVAIDDFGTGFASLNYLREYQADTIKIDQVFIQSKDGQVEKDNIIVGSVMEMAKGLKMKIIAEGVEEYGQYRFLRRRNCDFIQGFLFSRPVPVADFEKLLVKGVLEPDPVKVEKDRIKKLKKMK